MGDRVDNDQRLSLPNFDDLDSEMRRRHPRKFIAYIDEKNYVVKNTLSEIWEILEDYQNKNYKVKIINPKKSRHRNKTGWRRRKRQT